MSILSRENVGEFRRWELPEVGPGTNAAAPNLRTLRQLEDIDQRAREEGFASGLAEGRIAGAADVAAQVARIAAIVNALEAPFANLDRAVENELVLVATVAAARIARHEIALAPERILDAVRDAMAALPSYARNVRLFLTPEDAAIVRDHLATALSGHTWDIVEDSSLTAGGCRVQADTSTVDATLETRLATIIDALLGGTGATEPTR